MNVREVKKDTDTMNEQNKRHQIAGVVAFRPTSIEAEEALVTKHLLSTVKAVLVHQLSNKRSSGPLVLHTSLHQVDGIHSRRSGSYTNANVHTHTNSD